MYLHERDNWTNFYWKQDEIAVLLDRVARAQGKLYGRLVYNLELQVFEYH